MGGPYAIVLAFYVLVGAALAEDMRRVLGRRFGLAKFAGVVLLWPLIVLFVLLIVARDWRP